MLNKESETSKLLKGIVDEIKDGLECLWANLSRAVFYLLVAVEATYVLIILNEDLEAAFFMYLS